MKVGGLKAITTEMITKTATSTLITIICCFSDMFFQTVTFNTSSVSVELEVRTSEESVDMEAERTRTTVMPIRMSGSVSSICGTIVSYAMLPFAA